MRWAVLALALVACRARPVAAPPPSSVGDADPVTPPAPVVDAGPAAPSCPDGPEDIDGYEDQDGCNDPDNDRDGLLDEVDTCPNEPEVYDGRADEDGCPDGPTAVVTADAGVPAPVDRVYFAARRARLTADGRRIVVAVAAVLRDNPRVERLALVGRTARGEPARMAAQRARAVRAALIALGVDGARLEARAADNRAPLGTAALDRSVEFVVVRMDGVDLVDHSLLGVAPLVP